MSGNRRAIRAVAFALVAMGAFGVRAHGQRSWWRFDTLEEATSSTTIEGAQLHYYIEHNTRSGPDDLQGITRLIYANYSWFPRIGVNFYSGGHANGGNIYRDSYVTPGVPQLLGPSGYKAVSSLAQLIEINWWNWYWSGYWRGPYFNYSMYGAASSNSGPTDTLINVNMTSGRGTYIGPFGSHLGRKIQDIEGLAIQVQGGWWWSRSVLWGVTGFGYDGTPGDLFTIDKRTGLATYFGSLRDWSGNPPPNEITGITFDFQGRMFGCLGDGPSAALKGAMIQIDLNTRTFFYNFPSATGRPRTDLFFINGQ